MTIDTNACSGLETEVNYLEHVQAVVTLNSTRRGAVQLFLRSPMGTRSMILSERPNDADSQDGFTKWPFMTTHTWAEYPRGRWSLEIEFVKGEPQEGFVKVSLQMIFHFLVLQPVSSQRSGRCYCTGQRRRPTQASPSQIPTPSLQL